MTEDLAAAMRMNGFRDVLFRYNEATAAHRAEPSPDTMDRVQNTGRHLVGMYEHALRGTPLTQVLREVEAERCAQVAAGYDAAHDDGHVLGEIGFAAGLFVLGPLVQLEVDEDSVPTLDKAAEIRRSASWNTDRDPRKKLIICAALAIAEVERLDRAEAGRAG